MKTDYTSGGDTFTTFSGEIDHMNFLIFLNWKIESLTHRLNQDYRYPSHRLYCLGLESEFQHLYNVYTSRPLAFIRNLFDVEPSRKYEVSIKDYESLHDQYKETQKFIETLHKIRADSSEFNPIYFEYTLVHRSYQTIDLVKEFSRFKIYHV